MALAQVEQTDAIKVAVGVFDCQQVSHFIKFGNGAGSHFGVQADFFKMRLVPSQVVYAEAAGRAVKHTVYDAAIVSGGREECFKRSLIFRRSQIGVRRDATERGQTGQLVGAEKR